MFAVPDRYALRCFCPVAALRPGVMTGLDPIIRAVASRHMQAWSLTNAPPPVPKRHGMDRRVKPADDGGEREACFMWTTLVSDAVWRQSE